MRRSLGAICLFRDTTNGLAGASIAHLPEQPIVTQNMRVEDTLGLACKALGTGSGPDNARPLYLFFNFSLEIFHLAYGILGDMTEASLQFHIEKNDFFGTAATVLDLLRQDLARRKYDRHAETLTRLRDDLVYLQRSTGSRKS